MNKIESEMKCVDCWSEKSVEKRIGNSMYSFVHEYSRSNGPIGHFHDGVISLRLFFYFISFAFMLPKKITTNM